MLKEVFLKCRILLIIILAGCVDDEISNPSYIETTGSLKAEVTSYTPNTIQFKLYFFTIQGYENQYSTIDILGDSISVPNISQPNLNIKFKLLSLQKQLTKTEGYFSTAILSDQSQSAFNKAFNIAVGNRELACRSFFKNAGVENQVALAVFGEDSHELPIIKIEGLGFTNRGEELDMPLAYWSRHFFTSANTPLLTSIDSLLEYTHNKAKNSNQNLMIYSYGEDSSVGKTYDQIIDKAIRYKIKLNFALNLDEQFWPMVRMSQKTGGFCWYSKYLALPDYEFIGQYAKEIMEGDISCYEAVFEASFDRNIVTHGYWIRSSANVALDPVQPSRLFDIPFYIEVN